MKLTTQEFNDKIDEWENLRGLRVGTVWQHYKGGVYVIDGFGIDTHHGGFLVRYHRVAGPDYDAVAEARQEFFRPPEEWFEAVNHEQSGRFVLFRGLTKNL